MTELIYLAIPYSHPDSTVRERRFLLVNKIAAILIKQGNHVFSPISHCHPMAVCGEGELPTSWEFWEKYDSIFLNICKKLIVLTADGWERSIGVAGEIGIAEKLSLEIEYIDPYKFLEEYGMKYCKNCHGSGSLEFDHYYEKPCKECKGTGKL